VETFRVLGPLEALSTSGAAVPLGGHRQRSVLSVLLVHGGHTVSTERLIAQVWGTDPPPTVTTALQVQISALRKSLGSRLVTAASGYRLDVADDDVDAARFARLIAEARQHLTTQPAKAAAGLAAALALWRGEPYSGVRAGSDVEAVRQALTELRLSALEDRLDAELALGRHQRLVAELAGHVVEHPLRERFVRLHMLALYRCGRIAEAQRSYEELRRKCATELGMEPGADTVALARAIDRRDPTLDPPSTIPLPPSRFIGRRRELDELAALLPTTRLLTVTGQGGVGKTRLTLELARDAVPEYPDGVHVVELAAEPTGGEIDLRVAAAFSVRPADDEPVLDTLAGHLRRSRALIVLDNCEHVVENCAKLAADLLSRCTGLRILATSREPLGVPGEQVWALTGLGEPDALRLLDERGRSARSGFALEGDDFAVASRLCRKLDGLPLAIELAAAQLRTWSLDVVADRLDRRLDLADHRARTTSERHRTLRATIDWSYHLLSTTEQTALRKLAVFADSCLADTAEQMLEIPSEVLDRLADQSLLSAEPHPDGTRYRMLELVSEYAGDRLAEAGEQTGMRRRHALWCVELAETASPISSGFHSKNRLAAELAELRAAVTWCLDSGEVVLAIRIVATLWWYWWPNGLAGVTHAWLNRALEDAVTAAVEIPAALRASAFQADSVLALAVNDRATARLRIEQSLEAHRALGDLPGVVGALTGLCHIALKERNFAEVVERAAACRTAADAAGSYLLAVGALNPLGSALDELGRRDEAIAVLAEARQGFEAVNERGGVAVTLNNLAIVARLSGDLPGARAQLLEALALYRDLDLDLGLVEVIEGLASVEVADGNPEQALRMLTVTRRERRRLGTPSFGTNRKRDREQARADAQAALGERATAIEDAAERLPLHALADDLL
jgi:predicted ATPase/DNA-binding SARP family transcriptional activator